MWKMFVIGIFEEEKRRRHRIFTSSSYSSSGEVSDVGVCCSSRFGRK
jgi:hypothetical protein